MTGKKFEWIDHPADTGFRAYGVDMEEAFENAALALTEIMVDVERVEVREEIEVELEAEDLEALLYDWLDHLLYLFDAKDMVGSEFEVEIIPEAEGGYRIEARVRGEKYDPDKHGSGSEVKAMTYHMMEIDQGEDECSVQVVVDI